MHLKSIEMVGFKSFADKTCIELKPGISGVVGPNGCGKSNIVDALRWCLGEMSARSLRSKQMLDVIFAGASGRSPLNLAEVTLTFDNSHKLLPIEFTEIQVTRRLFRSGESEYYLNRAQCRLKDIKDLFMDTGIHEGYSILAQGEVDFVMNAKPEERRELFEEAAGISKYRARREETLRKLEKLELDLNRLNDLISVVKEQMDSLEAAARKAKLYQKIKEELKSLEMTDALHKIVGLDDLIKTAQSRMDELRMEYEKAGGALHSAEAQLTQYHLEQDAAEKELYEKNVAILELDKQMNASDTLVRTEKEREAEFEEQVLKLKEKIAAQEDENRFLEEKCTEARREIERTQVRLNELKRNFSEAKSARDEVKAERLALEESKEKISKIIFKMTSDSAAAANERNNLNALEIHRKSEAASLSREMERVRLERSKSSQAVQEIKENLEKIRAEKEEPKSVLLAAKAELGGEEERKENLKHQIQSLKVAIAHAEAQRKILSPKFDKDPYHKGTQSILNQGFPGLFGVLGVLFRVPAHMNHWVESVLGPKMNYLVFEGTAQAQEAIHWLKEHNLGRARCLILEKIPETSSLDLSSIPNGNSLLSFVQCEPALEKLKKYLLGSAFVSGATLYDAGVIDGGSDLSLPKPEEAEGSISFQNEFLTLKNVAQEISSNQELLKKLEEESFLSEANVAHLKFSAEEKEKEIGRLEIRESHFGGLAAKASEEADLASREAALLEKAGGTLAQELDQISSKLEVCSNKVDILNQSLAEKEQERTRIQNVIEDRKSQEHEREIKAKENEVRLETFNRDFEKIEMASREWQNRRARLAKDIESGSFEIEALKERAETARKKQAEETKQVQTCQEQKARIAQEVEELLKKKSDREEKNREFLAALEAARKRQTEVTEILHQVDLDLRAHENEKRNILTRMEETYQVNLEQIEQECKAESVEAEDLLKLKKRVESMSNSVNLEAPEQHQALSERYNFLNTQTQDLLKAREDLKIAIQQINATTKEQFKATFVKVRENFRKIYSTLFQGGIADLIFTDESNLLETGIDIVAQPPGKKLQNIALLSGGEKALTAIALLFAFFMVKPSPFCVLDEVDAPWDPSNVARFLNLLKEFSQKIQFLMVTHNPRTMEMADILYGVTMQEFGISKILSTRLKKESAAALPKEELATA